MAIIDLTGKAVILAFDNIANENVICIQDAVDAKQYLISLQSGVLTLTNVADDTEAITFTPDV